LIGRQIYLYSEAGFGKLWFRPGWCMSIPVDRSWWRFQPDTFIAMVEVSNRGVEMRLMDEKGWDPRYSRTCMPHQR